MQITSLLATGLLLIPETIALYVRTAVGVLIFALYFKDFKCSIYLLLSSIFIVIFFITSHNFTCINILFTVWLIFLMKKLGDKNLVKCIFYSTLMFSLVFCAFVINGLIHPDIVYIAESGRYRNNLGFWSANYPGFISFSCFMTLFATLGFLKKNIKNKYRIVSYIVMAFCFVIPWIADSRTPGYAMVMAIFFFMLCYINTFKQIAIRLIPFIPLAALVSTIYLSSKSGSNIDFILSGRLTYYHDFLRELNSWDYIFGTQLPDYALDSSYLILLSAFGISYILILTALLIKAVINNKNKFALTILFSLMCYGVTEAVMARAEIPVTILFISLMFINTNKKTELT